MTDYERTILNHYNLTTPYPGEWPAERDDSDVSEDEIHTKSKNNSGIRRSKSRYSALERSGSDRRNFVPGAERTGTGAGNLVQKDEADPLGGPGSVVRILRQRGLPVEDDARLRGCIMQALWTHEADKFAREPIHALIDYIFPRSLSISGSFRNFNAIAPSRSGVSVTVD